MTMHTVLEMTRTDQDAIHCDAYNAAFYELGLRWHWDLDAYRRIRPDDDGMQERIRAFVEAEQPHILKAYDVECLSKAIHGVKERCIADRSGVSTRPAPVNWAAFQAAEIGV